MTYEMEKKLNALLQDQEKMNAVFVKDPDQTRANLADYGIEINCEELGELCVGILEGMGIPVEDGELSESDLETVAGGFGPVTLVACCTAAILLGGYAFFKGYSNGMRDATNGSCRKASGGALYSHGYQAGQRIGGCI